MGMDYSTIVGFGLEIEQPGQSEQTFALPVVLGFSEDEAYDADPDQVDAKLRELGFTELASAQSGDHWSGNLFWSVFARSTFKELKAGKGNKVVTDVSPTSEETEQLDRFALAYPKNVESPKSDWLSLSVVS